ncbi:NUDIX hydrolase [Alteribacter keqinensis]|uniref:NUDIX domain-containing protein n=1 Tax=Alteribacter keqinensis TaxID=2483800 RepID=A0A3M7TZP7_9BACI|nr:NUDIX hydrolase [Alteribacter keqinensis]RNA69915.1 NUDIX domain-containing protein [Alteribacter keqinensis]
MRENEIRTLAVCVFSNNGSILVAEGYDYVKNEYFYRPVGGGIDHGEKSEDAVVREVKEELGTSVKGVTYLGTIENIFTFNGKKGHEIVQVYDAAFTDPAYYDKESFEGVESNGEMFKLLWISIEEMKKRKLNVVPEDLVNLF